MEKRVVGYFLSFIIMTLYAYYIFTFFDHPSHPPFLTFFACAYDTLHRLPPPST